MIPVLNIESILRKESNIEDSLDLKFSEEIIALVSKQVSLEERLKSDDGIKANKFSIDKLDTNRIFHRDTVKKVCTDYRLRFLSTKYFKNEIPEEAKREIVKLEKEHEILIEGFKIMAPSKLFKLEDKDDPLLFAPIGNDYYYLVHKWGNDLHPLRKILVWPFKSVINLLVLTLGVSFLATLIMPSGLFSRNYGQAEFWIVFFFMFKSIAAVVLYCAFALGKNFNPFIWNSKYFNA